MLNYIFSGKNFYLFLITKDAVEVLQLNPAGFNRQGLQNRIVSYREKLHDFYSDPSPDGRYLYNLLIKPAMKKINNARHLIITPMDELFFIPFDALDAGGNYFIDRFKGIVTYSISSTVLVRLFEKEKSFYSKDYFGLGDPDYQGRISQLTFTGPELDEVGKLFAPGSDIYKRLAASESRVKQSDLSAYRYIHFSCHGMNYGNTPFLNFPALLLAAEPGDVNDGYLRHDEISSLTIPAEMVLLSACQTGLGKLIPGDGLVGLNQAFFIAGADNVMASLWSVSDRYTMLLVTDFFRRLKNGTSLPLALKQAMLAIKNRQKQEYGRDHPFLWAPFVITGRS